MSINRSLVALYNDRSSRFALGPVALTIDGEQ